MADAPRDGSEQTLDDLAPRSGDDAKVVGGTDYSESDKVDLQAGFADVSPGSNTLSTIQKVQQSDPKTVLGNLRG